MKLVPFIDAELPEVRVQQLGSLVLISRNVIRQTFVVGGANSDSLIAVAKLLWDADDFFASMPDRRKARVDIMQQREERRVALASSLICPIHGRAN